MSGAAGGKGERIPIAADHAGFEMKEKLARTLRELGFDVEDLGTNSADSTDYPDYAHPLASKVAGGDVKRGVLLCGSGVGMDIAANRHKGVRAALAWNPEIAALSRKHNNSNVLVVPARFVSEEEGVKILRAWLDGEFEGGRHGSRVDKIDQPSGGAGAAGEAGTAGKAGNAGGSREAR